MPRPTTPSLAHQGHEARVAANRTKLRDGWVLGEAWDFENGSRGVCTVNPSTGARGLLIDSGFGNIEFLAVDQIVFDGGITRLGPLPEGMPAAAAGDLWAYRGEQFPVFISESYGNLFVTTRDGGNVGLQPHRLIERVYPAS